MRKHVPVLFQETIDALPEQCAFVMDGTLGHGGHSHGMIEAYPDITIVGVDRDEQMMEKAQHFLEGVQDHMIYVRANYDALDMIKEKAGGKLFDAILLDIGVNMDHFKEADRGFSIKKDGPLDMRYDTHIGQTAAELLAKLSYDDMLRMREKRTDFGSKFCDIITKDITQKRKRTPFLTTGNLRQRAKDLSISDKKLAVIFQAIRIETNKELESLEKFLQLFPDFLTTKGRCIIITYHSIEDRMVKYAFKDRVEKGVGVLINKKVIAPHWKEVKKNKAARSAKLRIFEKL